MQNIKKPRPTKCIVKPPLHEGGILELYPSYINSESKKKPRQTDADSIQFIRNLQIWKFTCT
jgi:hypothetical protein